MFRELIISELKEYVMPVDYDLHDWNSIVDRRTTVKDGVYSYPCVYADIMLTDELEFYDAIPKQPMHKSLDNSLSAESILVVDALKEYIPYKYLGNVDWNEVLARREEVKPNVYKYVINGIEFYLDEWLEPVEYGKVHIIDNAIYYDFERDSAIEYDAYDLFKELD